MHRSKGPKLVSGPSKRRRLRHGASERCERVIGLFGRGWFTGQKERLEVKLSSLCLPPFA